MEMSTQSLQTEQAKLSRNLIHFRSSFEFPTKNWKTNKICCESKTACAQEINRAKHAYNIYIGTFKGLSTSDFINIFIYFIHVRMPQEADSVTKHFDDVLRYVGEFGLWQKFLYFSSCFLIIVPSALQIASLVFATGTPKFHCVTPNVTCKESKCCEDCTRYAFDDSFTSTVTEVRNSQKLSMWPQIAFWQG